VYGVWVFLSCVDLVAEVVVVVFYGVVVVGYGVVVVG
jgi:hypothetical protein